MITIPMTVQASAVTIPMDVSASSASFRMGGGGGGSSDFSTAEVTVNDNSTQQLQFFVPLINDEFGYLGAYYNFNPDDSETLTVGLYKGKALTQFLTDGVVSVSGNAQLADDQILITGDCTITIS